MARVVPQCVPRPLGAAAQLHYFESKGLKPIFHFIGSRVETRRFQAMGLNLCSPTSAPKAHTTTVGSPLVMLAPSRSGT